MSTNQSTPQQVEDAAAETSTEPDSDRSLAIWLFCAAAIALASSGMLVYERLQIFIDAGHSSICDINALLNCGTVMRTPQAELFGFPNPFIGLVAFPVLMVVAAGILAGARYRNWFWVATNVGLGMALVFVLWLWFQTTFVINALCLFCMIVWVMTAIMFVKVTVRNIVEGVVPAPAGLRNSASGWTWFSISILLLLIFGIILIRFFSVITRMFA